jgi:hypothetical protein
MLLSKNRQKNTSKEEWQKMWDGMGYGLTPLHTALMEMKESTFKTKTDDFSIPNHYALLAFEAGKRAAYQEIIDMLPEGAKTPF